MAPIGGLLAQFPHLIVASLDERKTKVIKGKENSVMTYKRSRKEGLDGKKKRKGTIASKPSSKLMEKKKMMNNLE